MRVVYFMFLIAVIAMCDGRSSGIPDASPDNISLKSHTDKDKTWLAINWSKVTSSDAADPVLGYKVKIWTVKPVKKTSYVFNDKKELVSVEKEELPPINNDKEVSNEFTEIEVPADKTEATYDGVKKGVTYEVGVLAYTAKNKGAYTRKSRIQLN